MYVPARGPQGAGARLRFFGGAACIGPAGPLTGRIAGRHPLAVLAVLAASGDRGCSRDLLLGFFWADDGERRARHHLSDTLYSIRRALGGDALTANGATVALNTAVVPSDLAAFEQAVREGALEQAAALYTGHFLQGFHVDRAAAFDQWRDGERLRLQTRCADVLEVLAHRAEGAEDWATAVNWWHRAAQHDPYNSRCVRALARALVFNGDRGNALWTVREHAKTLERELGTEPPPEIGVLAADTGWEELQAWTPPPPPRIGNGDPDGGARHMDLADPPPEAPRQEVAPPPMPPAPPAGPAVRRRWRPGLMTAAAVVLLASSVLWMGMRRPPRQFSVAVLPFAVHAAEREAWGDGIANILVWRLNRVGPLTANLAGQRRAAGPARIAEAAVRSGAARVGARFALYGSVHQGVADSVRVLAWLLDVRANDVLYQADLRVPATGLVATTDSIAVGALTALSRSRGLGRVTYRSLGSTNHMAIKAFITGDWFLRQLALDSAVAYYRQAARLDSTFALAYSHWALALRYETEDEQWQRAEIARLQLLAGRLRPGLAPRESLLLTIDSIDGVLWATDRRDMLMMAPLLARARTTIDEARSRYPADPEVWYRTAEMQMHWTPQLPSTHAEIYDSYTRAIGLDSTWLHGYEHTLEYLTLARAGPDETRRAIEAYRRHRPAGYRRPLRDAGLQLLELLAGGDTATFWQRVEAHAASSGEVVAESRPLRFVYHATMWTSDTLEVGLRLIRTLGDRLWTFGRLAHHGRLAEARRWVDSVRLWEPPTRALILVPELTLFGAVGLPDSLRRLAQDALETERLDMVALSQGWWGEQGDTAVMLQLVRRWDSAAALPTEGLGPAAEGRLIYGQRASRGYLTLARGDTAEAIAQLRTYVVPPFLYCRYEFVTLGKLYVATGQLRLAEEVLRKCASTHPGYGPVGADVYVRLLWARVLERLGKRADAERNYRYVAEAWRRADAALVPYVEEARAALERVDRTLAIR